MVDDKKIMKMFKMKHKIDDNEIQIIEKKLIIMNQKMWIMKIQKKKNKKI